MSDRFKLLVFDWDGTLMDSEARIVSCLASAIEDVGLETRERHALKDIIGLGLREAIEALYPGSDDQLHAALTERYRHHFLEADQTPAELFPGAAETLAALAGDGYTLAVATGKGRHGLDKVLRETGLGPLFRATRCAEETRSKPHPQMLLELMAELGQAPEATLMVGDTVYDMEMAAHAAVAGLAVTFGVHAPERLRLHGPLACVDSVPDIRRWLRAGTAPGEGSGTITRAAG